MYEGYVWGTKNLGTWFWNAHHCTEVVGEISETGEMFACFQAFLRLSRLFLGIPLLRDGVSSSSGRQTLAQSSSPWLSFHLICVFLSHRVVFPQTFLCCLFCSTLCALLCSPWCLIGFASLAPLTSKKPTPLGRVCHFDSVPSHQQCCFRRSSTRPRAGNYPCISSLHPRFLWIFHFPSLFTVLMLGCPRSYGINDSCP